MADYDFDLNREFEARFGDPRLALAQAQGWAGNAIEAAEGGNEATAAAYGQAAVAQAIIGLASAILSDTRSRRA